MKPYIRHADFDPLKMKSGSGTEWPCLVSGQDTGPCHSRLHDGSALLQGTGLPAWLRCPAQHPGGSSSPAGSSGPQGALTLPQTQFL